MRQKLSNVEKQGNIKITVESIWKRTAGMSNWNTREPDRVQEFWLKKLTNSHDRVTKHSQACLNTGIKPPGVTKGRTLLIMKNIKKGGVAGSYIPIACLTIMWKFLTEINGDEI